MNSNSRGFTTSGFPSSMYASCIHTNILRIAITSLHTSAEVGADITSNIVEYWPSNPPSTMSRRIRCISACSGSSFSKIRNWLESINLSNDVSGIALLQLQLAIDVHPGQHSPQLIDLSLQD